VLLIRWFLNATRVAQLATDNRIGENTVYAYLYEGIDILVAQAPDLARALGRAKRPG
jgi:hypothetical protein